MRNYKTLFSFSFRDYGDHAGVWHDGCKVGILSIYRKPTHDDMADYCRALAAYLLEMAHNYDNAGDFTMPKFDKEHREKQIDKVREMMKPVLAKDN